MTLSRRFVLTSFSLLLAVACQVQAPPTEHEWQSLRVELLAMEELDQGLERLVLDQDPQVKEPGFFDRKQAQQDQHADRCRAIFTRFGFPGSDVVGAEASEAFWLLVQHADRDPDLQEQVATAMLPVVVSGHAKGQHLAYLTDRVRINTGRRQVYGTQIQFDGDTGRVSPKPLDQPDQVDALRKQAGLEPLWQYINGSTEMHFRMNAKHLAKRGIVAPPLLPAGYSDW